MGQTPAPPSFRTDRNRNPAAFTTDIAKQAGLVLGTDYVQGDSFTVDGWFFFTAKLLGDPVALTIQVIDKVGWQTHTGGPRWTYMDCVNSVWLKLAPEDKAKLIGLMYRHEGGTELKPLFA